MLVVGSALAELITDLIWYGTVGYDRVLLTRLGAQVALFLLGALLALGALGGNLWLAGRLALPPTDGSGGAVRGWIDRLNEAARAAERTAGGYQRPRAVDDEPRAVGVEGPEMAALIPIGRLFLGAMALLVVLGAAGGISGAWETVLLWQNRVPFAADAGAIRPPRE